MTPTMKHGSFLSLLIWLIFFSSAFAGEADVVEVQVTKAGNSTYNFDVTVIHTDTGWEHYANKWDIVDENMNILGTRILHHPHVNEQPFKRSLLGVNLPKSIKEVTVRAHDSVHEYGGKVVSVKLP